MKYGDIVVYNNQIGTVVKSENDFKFHPCNRGCCSFSLLDTIADNDVREATHDEKLELIEYAVKVANKRVPIIAGTGSNNTQAVIQMNKKVEKLGVDGVLIVTPYYNKTTQNGLIKHYEAIASKTKLPIILYNVPSRTGVNILPKTVLELSKIENIVAIKEASGDISQVMQIAYLCKENINVYSGNDDQIIPILSIGGKGVISVLSNIKPKLTHDICYKFWEGKINEASKMQLNAIPLINALFSEVNPIPVKEALNILDRYRPKAINAS